MKVRLKLTLLLYRPTCFCYVNDDVLMLIGWNLQKKSSEISIKTRSILASISFIGQVTKHTNVKWSIVRREDSTIHWITQLILLMLIH